MKKTIFINLGNKGVILSVKSGRKVIDSVFFRIFNQVTLPEVEQFFKKYKRADVYIILDTLAQNYNYKVFPKIGFFDLQSLVNRRFRIEVPEEDLKFKKFLYKREKVDQNIFLFVSANTGSPLKEWLSFLETVPNNLLGIYMLPYECAEFAKKILESIEAKSIVKEKGRWILLMINDRVSDIRQVAIFNNNIAFTRLISAESVGGDIENYSKKDIVRTSEYIKRFDSSFTFDKLTFISIFGRENKEKLDKLKLEKALVLNFTPHEIAEKLGLSNVAAEDEIYSDLVVGSFILENKKRKRVGTKDINILYSLFLGYKIFRNLAILSLFIVALLFGSDIVSNFSYQNNVLNLRRSIRSNNEEMNKKSQELFGMEAGNFDKIIDASTVREVLVNNFKNPIDYFQKFNAVQNEISLVFAVNWNILNFDSQKVDGNYNVNMTFNTTILNESGDVNLLFNKYDTLIANLKKSFPTENLAYSSLPGNIDFAKKYFYSNIRIDILETQPKGIEQ